ncbi:hypothetical protein [Pseudomonas syringae]|uniref:Uncharacterized protein n=1 Tax=Pseudomonas syringae pv. actinidiae TaxID=103796 RepID=A0A7Z6UDB5_PSESF|nr:hypothetical protein [Pseudomonas syringae]RMP84450.1 hypothetical protein ALQ15_03110 [Pseudomonas syringae pv. actinidiae]
MDDEIQEKSRPSFNESLDNMMGEAWNEVKGDFSHGTGMARAASTAKLFGKGSLYLGVKLIQSLPETLEKMKEKQTK